MILFETGGGGGVVTHLGGGLKMAGWSPSMRSCSNWQSTQKTNVTWSRGMSRMSGILILSYRLKHVTNSYVLHCFCTSKNVHISTTRCPIEKRFGLKCGISNGEVICTEKSKLNIADMWLIPLDCVTNDLLDNIIIHTNLHEYPVTVIKASLHLPVHLSSLLADDSEKLPLSLAETPPFSF